ncbi:lantibiotic dehydratase [Streptomyces sp. CAU 1734]|uniref:lantibiotic dehydratase n=1 Tax=Streptomyces sp. CAU 1734 TaxID=3140360 RepID=UPI0032612BC5
MIRTTLLALPAESGPARSFRAALAELTSVESRLTALAPALGDALYASRAGHGEEFHRQVVLPLRRAVHNHRDPRPAVLAALGDLPGRVPGLRDWLAARGRRAELLGAAGAGSEAALAAGRAALAGMCREPVFARAVSFTSADLLRAVVRAGEGRDDRRARKEEAGVLRHAMRASARTTPLSWFTAVGWGELPPATADSGRPGAPWSGAELPLDAASAVVRTNRTLADTLAAALLADPVRRAGLPHRMCSSLRLSDGRAGLARSRTAFASARFLAVEDDEVALAAAEPLRRLAALCDRPARLDTLARALAGPGESDAAVAFLRRLSDAGLLVPVEPFDPQDPDPLPRLAHWLRESAGLPGDREMAGRIEEITAAGRTFATAEPARRTAVLTGLRERWAALLGDLDRPVGGETAGLTVLSEDVVLREPVRLDGFLGGADHTALGELAALAELFDLGPVIRDCVRDRFVARYGPGGVCPHVWDFGTDACESWQEAARRANSGALWTRPAGPMPADGAGRLAALRAELVEAVHGAYPGGGADAVLPAGRVAEILGRTPPGMTRRPVSYSLFLQRGHGGLLCVNHVYGGWGRFSSRFLAALPPGAVRGTRAAVLGALAPGARAAQIRPVSGFNANLHPLFAPDEIGPDRSYTSLAADDVELFHDPRHDEVRVRLKATGEPIDVIYAGVFAPLLLQPRLAPLLTDHPHGITDFRILTPRRVSAVPGGELVYTPRLRHRHLVLRRRRWQLSGGGVAALRAELAAEGGVPVAAVARWRALLGVPDQVYLHAAPPSRGDRVADELLDALDRPRPQFIDLGDALHLRCLGKWLARHPRGAVLEEALPAPGPGGTGPAVELVVESHRPGRPG